MTGRSGLSCGQLRQQNSKTLESLPNGVTQIPRSGEGAKGRWARLGAELLVILVGILLALAVDSGWDRRQDERRAGVYLEQLRAELTVTSDDVERALARESGVLSSAERVLRGVYEPQLPPADSLTGWLARMFTSSSFIPTTSTVEALVATGDIQLVNDDRLRTEIVRYKQASEQLVRTFGIQDELLIQTVQRIGTRVSLPRLFADEDPRARNGSIVDWTILAQDDAFLSELFHVQSAAGNRARALEAFQERLRLLEAALE